MTFFRNFETFTNMHTVTPAGQTLVFNLFSHVEYMSGNYLAPVHTEVRSCMMSGLRGSSWFGFCRGQQTGNAYSSCVHVRGHSLPASHHTLQTFLSITASDLCRIVSKRVLKHQKWNQTFPYSGSCMCSCIVLLMARPLNASPET